MILWRHPPSFPTLIIGATRESASLIEQLNRHRSPLTPVAILDGHGTKEQELHGVPVRGKLDRLEEIIERERITHLIQCSDLEQSLNLLSACRRRSVTYMLLPSVLGIVERDERVESLEGHPITVVDPREKRGFWFFQ
jgi:FlaA1/EpsC-like NDP-sugar epimerase